MIENVWVVEHIYDEPGGLYWNEVVMICATLTGEAHQKFGEFRDEGENIWRTRSTGDPGVFDYYEATCWEIKE